MVDVDTQGHVAHSNSQSDHVVQQSSDFSHCKRDTPGSVQVKIN